MNTPQYSLGCGDRFGRQGMAQLTAYLKAAEQGVHVWPVWNKSQREHLTVGTRPDAVRQEAEAAVEALQWSQPYFVDADHISLTNVDDFIEPSDFFTLDVTEHIGTVAGEADLEAFLAEMEPYVGSLSLGEGLPPLEVSAEALKGIAMKYLQAMKEAGRIYRSIRERKAGTFIVEVSIDETEDPQTPLELFFILAMIAREDIPLDTIAPKFSGRFNKGVDYVGDPKQFEVEFEQDVLVLKAAERAFGLPEGLRLSVHSGSDKFAIYPAINRVMQRYGVGLHVKTAGTNWLEEVIGLAEAGGDGLELAQEIYVRALARYDELAAPYAAVIDIDPALLPSAETVRAWNSEQFVRALRHDSGCPEYNPGFRQLLHVAYKVAHELGDTYLDALERHAEVIGKNVTANLLERHLLPLFGTRQGQ